MASSTQNPGSQGGPFPTSGGSSGASGGSSHSGEGSSTGDGRGEEVMERMVQGAHRAVDRVAERAAPAVERLKDRVDSAAESVHAQTDRMNAMQEEWVEATRAYVREHPLQSIGMAVVAGVILSRMMSSH